MSWHAPGSRWNRQLPADAPLAAGDLAARLARQARYSPTSRPVVGRYPAPYNVAVNGSRFSVPVYDVPINQKRATVTWRTGQGVEPGHGPSGNLQGVWDRVPLPTVAHAKPGEHNPAHQLEADGSDRHLVVTCGDQLWEFFNFRQEGERFIAEWGGYVPDYTVWDGTYANRWGARACSLSAVGGLITGEDWQRGYIGHAVAVALPVTGGFLPPASRGDTGNMVAGADADRVPEGAWFRLPADFNAAAWAAGVGGKVNRETVRMLCQAMRDFGVVVVDTAGVVALYREDPRAYGTGYSRHDTDPIPATAFDGAGAALPWEQLQQLA